MANGTGLPYEILLLIFEELGVKEVTRCRLVCRAWTTPATERLFKYISLTNQSNIATFLNAMTTSTNGGGQFVKVLEFYAGSLPNKNNNATQILNTFLSFAQYCPNIQKLVYNCYNSPSTWDALTQIRENGQRKYLQRLPELTRSADALLYNKTALAYRDTLTHLELGNRFSIPQMSEIVSWMMIIIEICVST